MKRLMIGLVASVVTLCIEILQSRGCWMCPAEDGGRGSFGGFYSRMGPVGLKDSENCASGGMGDECLEVSSGLFGTRGSEGIKQVRKPCEGKGAGGGGDAVEESECADQKLEDDRLYGTHPPDCFGILNAAEAYDGWYAAKEQQIDIDGPHYAGYKWRGLISKEVFNNSLGKTTPRIAFKVLNSTLYVLKEGNGWHLRHKLMFRLDSLIEMLLLTIYKYRIPDMDFLVELNDELSCETAAFTYSLDTSCSQAGFSIPSYGAYEYALGPNQMKEFWNCLEGKYPATGRIEKAVWRGSSTGGHITERNYMDNARVKLARLAQSSKDIMDVGLTDYVQLHSKDVQNILENFAPLINRIPSMEQFNNFAAIFDLDGNGWSNRFSRLLTYNTPVLKQRSKFFEYFGHLLKDDEHVKFLDKSLKDVVPQLVKTLQEYREDKVNGQWGKLISGMHEFAKEHTTHEGVSRATAYGLNVYASKLTWKTEMEDGYVEIPMSACCKKNEYLPRELLDAVQAISSKRTESQSISTNTSHGDM